MLSLLAKKKAEQRRCEPQAPMPHIPPPWVPGLMRERDEYDLAESMAKRRKQEEDPQFILTCSLLKAKMNAWIKANPHLMEILGNSLPLATEEQIKAALDEGNHWPADRNEARWKYEDRGNVAVVLFDQVGWLCQPEGNIGVHIMRCHVRDEEILAFWHDEYMVFVPSGWTE